MTSDRSYKQNMKRSCWWKKSSYLSTYVGTCLANVLLYLLWCFPLNYVNFKWLKIRISMLLNPLKDKEIWHYFSKEHLWLGSWLKSFKDPIYSLMTEVKGFYAYIWISVIFGTLYSLVWHLPEPKRNWHKRRYLTTLYVIIVDVTVATYVTLSIIYKLVE